jgi:hypothetical protein
MNSQWQNPMAPITTKTPSGFSQLAGTVLNSAGQALGAGLGGMVTGGIGNLFSGFSLGGAKNGASGITGMLNAPKATYMNGGLSFGGL